MTVAPAAELSPPAAAGVVARDAGSARNDFLDAVRMLAGLGVVWVHTFPANDGPAAQHAGRFSVPFFTIIAVWLMARRPYPREPLVVALPTWGTFVRTRFQRLYVPFLIWNVVYTIARMAKGTLGVTDLDVGWFFGGASTQLWFLLFLLIVQCVVRGMQIAASCGAFWRVAMIGSCAVGMLPLFDQDFTIHTGRPSLDYFIQVSWHALPSACIGTATALLGLHRWAVPPGLCLVCLGLTGAAIAAVMLHGRMYAVETLSGLTLALASISRFNGKAIRYLGALGAYSLGIYLVHTGVLDAVRFAVDRPRIGTDIPSLVGVFVTTGVLSLLLCMLLVRLPYGDRLARWLSLKG
ncbi:MAG TPA: acyltransferase [Tepidisphaeraceae bacterium]|jgi:fucose 4-O-acetylase-like acetyltransferase